MIDVLYAVIIGVVVTVMSAEKDFGIVRFKA